MERRLTRSAQFDALTGAMSRALLAEHSLRLLGQPEKSRKPFAILLVALEISSRSIALTAMTPATRSSSAWPRGCAPMSASMISWRATPAINSPCCSRIATSSRPRRPASGSSTSSPIRLSRPKSARFPCRRGSAPSSRPVTDDRRQSCFSTRKRRSTPRVSATPNGSSATPSRSRATMDGCTLCRSPTASSRRSTSAASSSLSADRRRAVRRDRLLRSLAARASRRRLDRRSRRHSADRREIRARAPFGPARAWSWRSRACAPTPRYTLSVNASVTTLHDPEWPEWLTNATRVYSGVADRLTIEITETTLIDDFDKTRQLISDCKRLGIKFAMDDFGAGHTSFRNLRLLDFDFVKIDGVFIQNIIKSEERSLLRAQLHRSRQASRAEDRRGMGGGRSDRAAAARLGRRLLPGLAVRLCGGGGLAGRRARPRPPG